MVEEVPGGEALTFVEIPGLAMRGQDLMQPDPCNAGRLEVDRRVHQCAGRLTVLPQQSGGALDPPRSRCPRVREFYPTSSWRSSPAVHAGDRQPGSPRRAGDRPTPAAAAKLSVTRIAAALRRAGRSRGIDRTAAEIKAELRKPQLHQPVLVETAMGQPTLALLAALDTAPNSVEDLGRAAAEFFQTHPDYAIIISFPGLADSTGVRVFAEIGDDRARFADARALRPTTDRLPSPGLGAIPDGHAPAYQQQPARGRRLDVGVLGRPQL